MKIAVMQPYLFPYLGYFQLISAVDAFVLFDDVCYINRGWINRNNILAQGKAQMFTMELEGASQNKLINEIGIGARNEKLIKTIRLSYIKAPYFHKVFPVIEDVLNQKEKNLARFLNYQLRQVCNYLGISPLWKISSELKKDNSLRAQDKILAVCRELGATSYINLPGGKKLYDLQSFEARGVELSFLQPRPTQYRQFYNEYIPNLSIIDVMMFNSPCTINRELLINYDLLKN